MPWLTTEGASHPVTEGKTTVGSAAGSSWRLVSRDLAGRHFVVTKQGDEVSIRACGLDAVIAINGRQAGMQWVLLRDGDTIDAGSARILFSAEPPASVPSLSILPAHLVETRTGVAHRLASSPAGIGRDRLNSVVVRDATASRFHAEIRREAGGYVLHPHGSSGTLVNGRRLGHPAQLQDGDRIEIGNAEMRFVSGPIPAGVRAAEPVADDESAHRPTVIETSPVEVPSQARRPKWLLLLWIALLAGAAALLVATVSERI